MDLHCVICCEEFDLNERCPVVFPCGHTYVCALCPKSFAKKECHECREPLVWTPPKPQLPAITNHNMNHTHRSPATAMYPSRYNNRYSPSRPPPNSAVIKPENVEPIPYPLPKNLVLMQIIEAKQRQERLVAGLF